MNNELNSRKAYNFSNFLVKLFLFPFALMFCKSLSAEVTLRNRHPLIFFFYVVGYFAIIATIFFQVMVNHYRDNEFNEIVHQIPSISITENHTIELLDENRSNDDFNQANLFRDDDGKLYAIIYNHDNVPIVLINPNSAKIPSSHNPDFMHPIDSSFGANILVFADKMQITTASGEQVISIKDLNLPKDLIITSDLLAKNLNMALTYIMPIAFLMSFIFFFLIKGIFFYLIMLVGARLKLYLFCASLRKNAELRNDKDNSDQFKLLLQGKLVGFTAYNLSWPLFISLLGLISLSLGHTNTFEIFTNPLIVVVGVIIIFTSFKFLVPVSLREQFLIQKQVNNGNFFDLNHVLDEIFINVYEVEYYLSHKGNFPQTYKFRKIFYSKNYRFQFLIDEIVEQNNNQQNDVQSNVNKSSTKENQSESLKEKTSEENTNIETNPSQNSHEEEPKDSSQKKDNN